MNDSLIDKRVFRPEIEGIRAVAAILVAVYHVWFGTVSGGVDVFFIVSGFLITTTLLAGYDRNGEIRIMDFFMRLVRRLFPMAFLVLSVTAAASWILLPEIRWLQTLQELMASALYVENWLLAVNSVDYLAQNNEASPVQHFWALSMQGQFYLLWPFILIIALRLSWYSEMKTRDFLRWVLSGIFILSIVYSIYITTTQQVWAYFDTVARLWEFTLGGLTALFIGSVRFTPFWSRVIGWTGLIVILGTGAVLPVEDLFPGIAALLPTLGAVAVITAAPQLAGGGVQWVASAKPLVWFGQYAYAFYLWHWPVLIFYYLISGVESVSWLAGMILIGFSFCLAVGTTLLVENPLRSLVHRMKPVYATAAAGLFILPFVTVLLLWQEEIDDSAGTSWLQQEQDGSGEVPKEHDDPAKEDETNDDEFPYNVADPEYPGAMGLFDEVEVPDREDVIPSPVNARDSLPPVYEDDCHQNQTSPDVIACSYGYTEDDPEYTIALVGGSHSAHWLPALQEISEEYRIHIESYTKSNCRFTTDDLDELSEGCLPWGETLLEMLLEDPPDLVFTTSTAMEGEEIPEGFLDKWLALEDADIEVFAVRDVPWMDFDVAACVSEEGESAMDACTTSSDDVLYQGNPWGELDDQPGNVTYADLNPYVCPDGDCLPIIGNVLVYRDSNHLTLEYVVTLTPLIEEKIIPLLEKIRDKK
ncbi:Putative peptidoglycan O-acetyltransferase YrhL [Salisediminibacterium beveridgei]|uniref:Putative peptidoglycan O-acetyltransferase YrhL n=1 Tax=Salisediminibacterium beveridgei TaxID=632773 RepID=A0A1D7QXN9_9BACI|nr:Putative peptidoglycan O-acetyltransferase YrhL [Salisediminibacterium beveridgei]